jgi:hypothetical protein
MEAALKDCSRCSASGLITEASPAMSCNIQLGLEGSDDSYKPGSFYRTFRSTTASPGPHDPA